MPSRKLKLKINAISGAPRYHFWEGNIHRRSTTRPQKAVQTYRMSPTTSKKKEELKFFLGNMSYLEKFSPSIAEVCETLRKLMS